AELEVARTDVTIGMLLSNVVGYFVIVTTAATLYQAGRHDIETTRQAAEALRPFAGNAAYVLFSIGLIGSGLLAVRVLAGSASSATAELLGWRAGLDETFPRARRFYSVFAVAVVLGIAVNAAGISPIRMLYLSAIVNGIAAPPLLLIVMLGA